MSDALVQPSAGEDAPAQDDNTQTTETQEGGEQQTDTGQQTNEQTGDQDTQQQTDQGEQEASEDGLYAGKYKTVDELEKGYKEAVQKLTEKNPEPPETYNLDLSEDEDLKQFEHLANTLDVSEDPLVQQLDPVLRKHNITNDAAKDIAKAYLQAEFENTPDPQQEKEKLGDQASEILNNVNTFVGKNFSAEEQKIIQGWGASAEDLQVLNKLARMTGEKNIPAGGDARPQESAEDLREQARQLKEQNNGNLHGDTLKKYESLMDKAAKISLGKA